MTLPNYKISGSGPAVIFTHGWMLDHTVWSRQSPLAEQFQLIEWDLPYEQSPLNLDVCAQALRELVLKLGHAELSYVGWSLGCSVFWRYGQRYGFAPFTRFVNVEMLPRLEAKDTQVEVVSAALQRKREHTTRKFLNRVFLDRDHPALEAFVQKACTLPLGPLLELYQDMSVQDLSAGVAAFAGQEITIWGEQGFYADRLTQLQALFPRATMHVVPHAAHAVFWDQAQTFNQLISSSLSV